MHEIINYNLITSCTKQQYHQNMLQSLTYSHSLFTMARKRKTRSKTNTSDNTITTNSIYGDVVIVTASSSFYNTRTIFSEKMKLLSSIFSDDAVSIFDNSNSDKTRNKHYQERDQKFKILPLIFLLCKLSGVGKIYENKVNHHLAIQVIN